MQYESDMSKKFNAAENLWYKHVVTFFSSGETTDGVPKSQWSCKIHVLLGVMVTSTAKQWVFRMDGHGEQHKSKLKDFISEQHTFFQQCSQSWASVGFVMNHWIFVISDETQCMSYQCFSDTATGVGLEWNQCRTGVGWCRLEVCGCKEGAGKVSQIPSYFAGEGADKKFQPGYDFNAAKLDG